MGGVAWERWRHRRLVAGLWPDIDGKYCISPTDLAADRRWSQTFDINDDCGRIGWCCLLDIAGNSIYPCSINLMLSQPFIMARGRTEFWLRYKRKFELTEFHIMRFHYMFTVHWSTDLLEANVSCNLPLVLWRCQLGARKNIRPIKIDWWLVMWLSVWSEVQIVCIWSSWCYCIPKSHLLPHLNPDWFYFSGSSLPRLSWKRGH